MADPASIRFWNPGAMWPGPSATAFGATGFDTLNDGQGNKIARFPDAESGGAAQFDLLKRGYSGMRLADAIRKWSGGNHWQPYASHISKNTGLTPDTVLTPEFLADPSKAVPLAKAMAHWEAGRPYPMTDEQWNAAHVRFLGGPKSTPVSGTAYDMYGETVKPAAAPITTGSNPQRTSAMPTDPVTGQWVPETVIKSQYDRANQFWDTPRATSGLGAIAEGLGGFFGQRERTRGDEMVQRNQGTRDAAVRGMAGETDSGRLGQRLLASGIPGLQEQGMQLIAHDAQKRADLQAQGEMQRQRAEHERRLQLDLAKEKARHDKELALEMKRRETEETMGMLKAIGFAPGAPQATAPSGVPGVSLDQPLAPGATPPAALPTNPNAEFAEDLLPSNAHKAPTPQQNAGLALALKQPGKAVDFLAEKGKLTEGQTKDASFAERMLRSEAGLREVTPTDKAGQFMKYDPTKNVYRFMPDWNVTNSKEWQQYTRNAREGIAAILRKDTGAAVSDTEWNWYFPMYYPQPGDSPQVVRDKQQARVALAKGLRNGSGPAFDQMYPDFDKKLRERLLAQGADLTPKGPPPGTGPQSTAPGADGQKYAQVRRNPKTGEMAGYNPQTGKWEIIAQQEAPKEGDFKRSIANRGLTTFPEPQDMN